MILNILYDVLVEEFKIIIIKVHATFSVMQKKVFYCQFIIAQILIPYKVWSVWYVKTVPNKWIEFSKKCLKDSN
jgi:hypothetical protein